MLNYVKNMAADLHDDESGAAFIEYTALLGIILAVGLAVMASVGGWAHSVWANLANQLPAAK